MPLGMRKGKRKREGAKRRRGRKQLPRDPQNPCLGSAHDLQKTHASHACFHKWNEGQDRGPNRAGAWKNRGETDYKWARKRGGEGLNLHASRGTLPIAQTHARPKIVRILNSFFNTPSLFLNMVNQLQPGDCMSLSVLHGSLKGRDHASHNTPQYIT